MKMDLFLCIVENSLVVWFLFIFKVVLHRSPRMSRWLWSRSMPGFIWIWQIYGAILRSSSTSNSSHHLRSWRNGFEYSKRCDNFPLWPLARSSQNFVQKLLITLSTNGASPGVTKFLDLGPLFPPVLNFSKQNLKKKYHAPLVGMILLTDSGCFQPDVSSRESGPGYLGSGDLDIWVCPC